MQLLVLILKKIELIDELNQELAEAGITGGTILDGNGMAKSLMNMDEVPIFGHLRHILSEESNESCKVMMFVLRDEHVLTARETIKKVIGTFDKPNSAIMFAVHITYVEGIGE